MSTDWSQGSSTCSSTLRVADVQSAIAYLERSVWPLTTITPPALYVDSSVRRAIEMYSDIFETMWPHLNAPSTTSTTHQQGRFSDMGKGDLIYNKGVVVNAIAAEDAAAAYVSYGGLRRYGSSKRNKHERKDTSIGLDLAVGRALISLGRALVADAEATLEERDA